jgi:glycosyltransferase involved in cell wall biosynthesis
MNNPLVSILIPTYNRAHSIDKTIDSILAQSYKNWECIIVDDGSTDETEAIVDKYIKQDTRIFYTKRPFSMIKGPSVCRNIGLTLAKGDYIQFFDDDDTMFTNMLECKINTILKENADVVVSPLQFFDVTSNQKTKENNIVAKQNSIIEDYILGNVSWYVSGPLWKKDFLKISFDEKIQTLDDWDFNLRNLYLNPKTAYIHQPLQFYYIYPKGQTLSTKAQMGDINQKMSSCYTYKKHLSILKEKKILSNKMEKCLVKRLLSLLNGFMVKKNPEGKILYSFMKKHLRSLGFVNMWKVKIGFLSYSVFGVGYRFFKI